MMEELKVIVNLIQQLGVEGKTAFIWWLVMDKGLHFVFWIVFTVTGFYCLSRLIVNILVAKYIQELRDLMEIGSPGNITLQEINQMFSWVIKHKEK